MAFLITINVLVKPTPLSGWLKRRVRSLYYFSFLFLAFKRINTYFSKAIRIFPEV